jgi:NAD-dependent dihydropyrimidine dehydrogenase PreA subunit
VPEKGSTLPGPPVTRCRGGGFLVKSCFRIDPLVLRRKILMAYVIAEPCIGTKDSACVDACPVDCIHPKKDEAQHATEEMLYIDPVECIDCGACVPVCPVSAIFALDDLPEKWKSYAERNAKYFGR